MPIGGLQLLTQRGKHDNEPRLAPLVLVGERQACMKGVSARKRHQRSQITGRGAVPNPSLQLVAPVNACRRACGIQLLTQRGCQRGEPGLAALVGDRRAREPCAPAAEP